MYFPPYFSYGSAGELFIFFVADGIEDFDLDDDVSRHNSVEMIEGLRGKFRWPLALRSFAASSGIFLRRTQPQPVVPRFAQAVSRGLVLLV